jgi:hypothetical protein
LVTIFLEFPVENAVALSGGAALLATIETVF